VRVTFKAEKGGSFGKDKDGNDIIELNYDVIRGLKSDLLPVPKELAEGETVDKDKHYITPETGRKFVKWDKNPLLNKNTIINENHTFTAYFEWSGLTASGLVRTEAFKDPENKWTNNFAPKIEDLKKQLVWREKDQVKDLPAGAKIQLFDAEGNELTTDEQVYELVNEKKAADKDELVRTVNVKAKVTFKDGKEPQELTIPITVYKNVYEALNKEGDKPLFLKEAEGKEAKDGGLKDVTGNYVKVTIAPTGDMDSKDNKVYYVNPKAWVEIPEVSADGSSTFINWTADQVGQNDDGKEKGKFDFAKRHKFTKDTIITPVDTTDVVEQKDPNKKPDVPNGYVKVIVKTTDKATDETKFEKTFWVNPTKEVTITVDNPVGKENQKFTFDGLGEKDVNYIFKEWQKVQTGEADDSLTKVNPVEKIELASHKYTDKVTVIEAAYKKSIQPGKIENPLKTTKLDTPQGKEITNDDLIKQITPQEGKEIESIEVISKPDGNTVGNEPAKVIVKYKDGSTQGTNDNPVVIPVEVHKNIIPEAPGGQRPKDAMDNYVKVIFKAGTGGSLSGDLVYYVSPEVEVDMTDSATKITKNPDVGYISGDWDTNETKKLKDTFKEQTEFTFSFTKTKDIVEKIDDNVKKPDGYVEVIFKTEDENKGKLDGDKLVKTYYVNPKAGIKLVELSGEQKAEANQLVVPTTIPNKDYGFAYWSESLDLTNTITGDREYVAHFTKGQVTLTYDAGGAEGNVPDPESTNIGGRINLSSPSGLSNGNKNFIGWMVDGSLYQAGSQLTLTKDKTAVAKWTEDIYPADENGNKTEETPENYVKVTLVPTEKAIDSANKIYYVNPDKYLTIPAEDPKVNNEYQEKGYSFSHWDPSLSGKFVDGTVITAKYKISSSQIIPLEPDAGIVETRVGIQPNEKDYKDKITPPKGKTIKGVEIIEKPDVSKEGVSSAKVNVIYTDGSSSSVDVTVVVYGKIPEKPDKPDYPYYPEYPGGPIPMYPEVRYETIIQEKIVKVPVPVSDNYFKEVRYMQGFNGYFRPNDGLTRAEAAQILANALVEDGYKYNPNFKISYKDIGEAWYTRAVKIVTEANVFAGYDDGNFKPQAKITRNEWIATLKRFQELGDASGNNMNLRDDHWAKGEIQAAFNEGWLKIYTDGLATYKGDEFIPRQEVAAVSNKAFKRIVDKTYIGKNNLGLVTYKDVNTSMWAYEDILCASNTFLDRKDRYIAHWVKEDKNQFNIDTSDLKIVQKNFQRNPR
ncbi:MAG: S-layer homology domain-containing protein, partial [Peptoniphilus sp.]